jgi:hypothetical protein
MEKDAAVSHAGNFSDRNSRAIIFKKKNPGNFLPGFCFAGRRDVRS